MGEATRWVPFPPVPGAEQVTASCTPLRAEMWKPYWSVWIAHQRAVKAVRTVKGDDMVVKKANDWEGWKRVERVERNGNSEIPALPSRQRGLR